LGERKWGKAERRKTSVEILREAVAEGVRGESEDRQGSVWMGRGVAPAEPPVEDWLKILRFIFCPAYHLQANREAHLAHLKELP
jgi:hypothetical protein